MNLKILLRFKLRNNPQNILRFKPQNESYILLRFKPHNNPQNLLKFKTQNEYQKFA